MVDPQQDRKMEGVEAVIDKDRATELLARDIEKIVEGTVGTQAVGQ